MVVATKAEILKRKKKLEGFQKVLDEDGRLSEKKLCTQIRSAVRLSWMKHPVKLAYLYEHTYPDVNPNTRTKWLVDCEMCNLPKKLSDIEINHKKGENPLLSFEDVVPFAKSILGVTADDLECLCIECHAQLTYSQRYGVTLEQAKDEKAVIAKLKQPVSKQKTELKKAEFTPKEISNADLRRVAYRKMLTQTK